MLKDSLPNISKNVLKVLSVFISKIYTDLTFAFKQLKRKDVEEFQKCDLLEKKFKLKLQPEIKQVVRL